jgi:hypothetical protein
MAVMSRIAELFREMNPLRRKSAPAGAEPTRSPGATGSPTLQTDEEREGTRQRMVAELDHQREKRSAE